MELFPDLFDILDVLGIVIAIVPVAYWSGMEHERRKHGRYELPRR